MRQTPVRAYLDPHLARELARRAAAQGRSQSSLIGEIVRTRLAAASEAAREAETETMKRQLNRLEARFDKLLWEELQLKECLLLFIRVWLEHNPPIEEALEESAAASAEARFERFLDLLASTLTTRPPRDLSGEYAEDAHGFADDILEAGASA
jgi:thioredoxin-like negative regulator of GroEL